MEGNRETDAKRREESEERTGERKKERKRETSKQSRDEVKRGGRGNEGKVKFGRFLPF